MTVVLAEQHLPQVVPAPLRTASPLCVLELWTGAQPLNVRFNYESPTQCCIRFEKQP